MALSAHELANYDEARVVPYSLPPALVSHAGEDIDSPERWFQQRRPEVLRLFERGVYGLMPPPHPFTVALQEEGGEALGGKAIRRQVRLQFEKGAFIDVVVYIPRSAPGSVPCFLGLNFWGNHASFADPAVLLSTAWMRPGLEGVIDNRATEAARATQTSRWPLEAILSRGYALATAYYGDIDPDFDDGFENGVHPLFKEWDAPRGGDAPASITAWSWGLSRIMDYLETQPEIDAGRVCLTGHSRLGKAALWAAACDQRFALVVSNNSGCGGAALSRRNYGETMDVIVKKFPHWFCGNGVTQAADVHATPVDQHLLISLVAPRPVFISSAEEDRWADPKGEFLGGWHASEVYRLLGEEGLEATEMPGLNQPIHSRIGYYIRPGKHDITPGDWAVHLDFADRHLRKTV